jgi:hypothetical protein
LSWQQVNEGFNPADEYEGSEWMEALGMEPPPHMDPWFDYYTLWMMVKDCFALSSGLIMDVFLEPTEILYLVIEDPHPCRENGI